MIKLTYKTITPKAPAPVGLVKKITLKKEAHAKTVEKIRAAK